jgi:hypothetical protein
MSVLLDIDNRIDRFVTNFCMKIAFLTFLPFELLYEYCSAQSVEPVEPVQPVEPLVPQVPPIQLRRSARLAKKAMQKI